MLKCKKKNLEMSLLVSGKKLTQTFKTQFFKSVTEFSSD